MEGNKRILHFMVPTEDVTCGFDDSSKEFTISGQAIHAVTTRNGHTFTVQELQTSAKTLQGKPLLKDHINSVDYIVGRVKKASFDAVKKSIPFVARVTDKAMQEKISSGDVVNVSVGAMVDDVEEVEGKDGSYTYVLKGVEFLELSLVAVPADPNAGFGLAQAVLSSLHPQNIQSNTPSYSYAHSNAVASYGTVPTITSITTGSSTSGFKGNVITNTPTTETTQEEAAPEKETAETEKQTVEAEVSNVENDKNQEILLSAISKLTDAVTAVSEKVAALEAKKLEEAKIVPQAAPAAAPESKGVVGQAPADSKVTKSDYEINVGAGLRGELSMKSYDKESFPNLHRSTPSNWRAE